MMTLPVSGSAVASAWRFLTPTDPWILINSVKCVATKDGAPILVIKYSEMAQANPNPSQVDVPLPSSSTITKDRLVAPWKAHC